MAALVVVLAAACGGGDKSTASVAAETRKLPACAGVRKPIMRPEELPKGLPLPPGTILTSAQTPFPGQLVLRGVIPAELGDAASFFRDELPGAGYEVGRGDSERGEVEALFTGEGLRGGWRVNAIARCPEAVGLVLVIVQQA